MVHKTHILVYNNDLGVFECLRCYSCTCHHAKELESICRSYYDRIKKKRVSNVA